MKRICSLLLVFTTFLSFGQQKLPNDSLKTPLATMAEEYKKYLPNFAPLSPNAAGIQQYGNHPVNMPTGLADISIPIHTAKDGKLSLPITLRYHGSGHQISELASWVGWGWSLDISAFLSRIINGGIADDKSISTNYLNTSISPWDLCNTSQHYTNANAVNDGSYDLEPDLFSYITPEESGKFYLRQNGLPPMLIPFQAVKISHDYATENSLKTFKIVASSGNEYVFGKDFNNQEATEYQSFIPSSGSPVSNGIVTWHLTKILSPNTNDAIFCTYQDGGSTTQSNYFWNASATFYNGSPVSFSTDPQFSKQERLNTQKNIHKITFTNGEIEFIQSTILEPRLDQTNSNFLKTINIYNYENGVKTLLKKFDFEYSYFTDRTGANGRLKLDKLIERNQNSTEALTHSFDYFTNTYSWRNDVSDTDFNIVDLVKQDYFGYFNGKNNNHLIDIASYNGVAILNGVADRSTVTDYMKECVLSKITYPTGGFSTFDYEANKYKQVGVEKLAGGLRIKEIKSFTSVGNQATIKRYEYSSDDGVGVGKLTNIWSSPSSGFVGYVNNLVGDQIHKTDFIGSNGLSEMDSFEGTPIYYTTVKEFSEEIGATETNGYSEHQFSFEPDVVVNIPPPQSSIRDIEPWKRGLLLSKKVYDKNGILKAETTNTYQEFKQLFITNQARLTLNNNSANSCAFCTSGMPTYFGFSTSCDYPKFNYATSNNKTGQMKMISSISTLDNVTTSQSSTYDDNLFPKTTESSDSYSNEKRIQENIYSTDASYDLDLDVFEMRSRNMINMPLESIEKEDFNGNISTIFKQKTVYSQVTGSNARGLTQNLLPKEIWVAPTGGSLEKRVDFTQYDTFGNPKEYVVDDLPTSLIWGYNNSLVLGIFNNSTQSQASTALSNAGISENAFSVNDLSAGQLSQLQNLRNSLPNSQISWFTHRPMVGLAQNLGADGIKMPFIFDNFQRLKLIKDHDLNITDKYLYLYASTVPSICIMPNPPTISITNSTLCDITLTASSCVGTITWSNGSANNNITISSKTTQTFTATCTDGVCISSASNSLIIPPLPSGWTSADVGSAVGCTQNNSPNLTLQGSGTVGLSDDTFHWIYKSMSGDFTMIAKIANLPAVDGMRSGIMIRSNTNSNAQFYTLIQDGNANVGQLKRDTDGGTGGLYSFAGSAVNQTWIKIIKTGNSIKAFYSTNANPEANNAWDDNFSLTGTAPTTMNFGTNFLIGLVTYGATNQTTFSNITINGNAF
jgi:hypothetical protein